MAGSWIWNSAPYSDAHLDKSTVYRWIKGETLPKNSHAFLRLAALLDVDPFALLAVSVSDIVDAADQALRIVQSSYPGPPSLQFVHVFFGRQINWPPGAIASKYFKRSWYVEELSHDPSIRANYYAEIVLRHALQVTSDPPQIFHFAFRHPTMFRARWLQYGLVRAHGTSQILHHINGHVDQVHSSASHEPIRVETWFGPGPALFRIASLHPFSHRIASLEVSSQKALRFPG